MSQVEYKPTVQVGAKVVVVRNPYNFSATFTGEREVVKINWTSKDGTCIGIKSDDGRLWNLLPNAYRIVGDFRVGDKVKILPTSRWYGLGDGNPIDEVGVVFQVDNGLIIVQWKAGKNHYNSHDLEYVPSVEKEKKEVATIKADFKVGQLVRFKDEDGAGSKSARHGDVGVVVSVGEGTRPFRRLIGVDLGECFGRPFTISAFEHRWEVVAEKDIPWLRVGAEVRVVDSGRQYSTYTSMAESMGLMGWFNYRQLPARHAPLIKGKVVSARKHDKRDVVVVAIELPDGTQYLIDTKGLEPVVQKGSAEGVSPSKSVDSLINEYNKVNKQLKEKEAERISLDASITLLEEQMESIAEKLLECGVVYTPK